MYSKTLLGDVTVLLLVAVLAFAVGGCVGGAGGGGAGSDGGDDGGLPSGEGEAEGAGEGEGGTDDSGAEGGGGDIQPGTLTAGSFDDNLNLEVFEEFVSDMLQNDPTGTLPTITLGERVIITVRNDQGQPVPNANVTVVPAGQESGPDDLIDMPTGSDGRAFFSTGLDGAGQTTTFDVIVYPPDWSEPVFASGDLTDTEWEVTLPDTTAALPGTLELAFVVDATGSMGDELEYLKVEMDSIASAVADGFPNVQQRYALVVYRDDGDEYVTLTFDFTDSLDDFQADLADQVADGGGDLPEAMHDALAKAEGLSWSNDVVARVLFLVADAPPHTEDAAATLDSVRNLRMRGVAIYPVAASGVAEEAELIMRTAALTTLSEYIFLTDESGVGLPHAEPHIPCYVVERLNDVMIRMIEAELTGQKVYPDLQTAIKVVGNPVDGVCVEDQDEPDGQ